MMETNKVIINIIPSMNYHVKMYLTKPSNLLQLTLSMLRLLSSKAQELKMFRNSSKSCQVGIHLKALIEYFHMSTHLLVFQLFSAFFTLFCID